MASEYPPPSTPEEALAGKIFFATRSVLNIPVQSDFRLVAPYTNGSTPMQEFVSRSMRERFIAVDAESDVAAKHARLTEERLPVFSGMYTPEGLLMLHVPRGTKPLTGFANSMRRNTQAYAPVFREIGETMKALELHEGVSLGPTEEYPLLRQFALAVDDQEESGGRTFLLPPYNLAPNNRRHFLQLLDKELLETQVLLPKQAQFLVEQVYEGWTQ